MNKGVMIAVAVAIAAALGVVAQRHMAAPASFATPAPATATTAAPDAAPAAEGADGTPAVPAPKIPETLPQFALADADGKPHKLGEWKGRPLMVNYWATWCGPCRREIPLLNQLRSEHQARKLEIIGIAVDFRDDVLQYVKETQLSYPLLIGEEDGLAAVQAMGMQPAFPFSVFADSQQRIVALKVGELHRDEAELILDRVDRVDAGTLPLAQAREEITEGLKELATRRATAKPAAG